MEEELPDGSSFPSLEEEDLQKFFPEKLSRSLHIPPLQTERENEPGKNELLPDSPASSSSSSSISPRYTLGSLLGLRPSWKKKVTSSSLDSCNSMRGVTSTSYSHGSSLHSMSSFSGIAHSGGAMSQVVVAVFDATKKLTFEAVDWGLLHILQPGDTLVIMGIITKISTPLGVDILPDIDGFRGINVKVLEHEIAQRLLDYQKKLQARRLFCEKKGFNLEVRITAGYPLKNVLVREALELHATWVVLDWHLRGRKNYFMDRLECSLVLMEKNSDVGRFLRISSIVGYAPLESTQASTDGVSRRHEFTLEGHNTSGYSSSRASVNSDRYDHRSLSNVTVSDVSFSSMCSLSDGR